MRTQVVTIKVPLYEVDEDDRYIALEGDKLEEAKSWILSKDDVAGWSIYSMDVTEEDLNLGHQAVNKKVVNAWSEEEEAEELTVLTKQEANVLFNLVDELINVKDMSWGRLGNFVGLNVEEFTELLDPLLSVLSKGEVVGVQEVPEKIKWRQKIVD